MQKYKVKCTAEHVLLLAVCRAVSANYEELSADPQTYKIHFAAKLDNMTNSSSVVKV